MKLSSQFLLILFLILYCFCFYYFLNLNDKKNNLKDEIIKEKINLLQKEHKELIKTIKYIEEHPNTINNIIKQEEQEKEQEIVGGKSKKEESNMNIITISSSSSSLSQINQDLSKQPVQPFQQHTQQSKTKIDLPPGVLVVGGTDGSGTRRVVQILTQLGVLIVSEDPETYDIHADLFGGWPKVVEPVLRAKGSITYDVKDVPDQLRATTIKNLNDLLKQAEKDSQKPQSKILGVGGALPRPPNVHASRVNFGFKAPVAMTLLPWWKELNPHFLFIHVLRDGRDIAFSANQGPVTKFYDAMYKNVPSKLNLQDPVKAIQLWSDWNGGIQKWAQNFLTIPNTATSSFNYMSIHIEDLVDESRDIRYKAIKKLAEFVGSDLDSHSLCCLAVEGSKFMGSHDREGQIGENADNTLKKKYGKWKSIIASSPELGKQLLRVGETTLKELGYILPTIPIFDSNSDSSSCKLTPAQCNAKKAGDPDWRSAITSPPKKVSTLCEFDYSTDYFGGDLTVATSINDADECCEQCFSTGACKYFTFNTESNVCYMKMSKSSIKKNDNLQHLVSGRVIQK